MDIDRITINLDCPQCGFSTPAFYRQARLRAPLICRGCHCTIQLDDHMNECRKARLFFFYRSDCPYCHAFAPTLEAFQARHGMKVVAIGVDGGPIPGFPDARADNGIATTLKVTQVPAVFLAQPFTGKITPIGFGVLSEAQLLERIALVSAPQADAMVPGTSLQIGRQSVLP